jgi:UDP-GlcNAc:undecaprenyl-phosphate GlcNAc-1-phosphate transferase
MWLYFAIATLISTLITPMVIWFFQRQGWVEDPKQKKHVKITHQRPLPRGGGLAIFVSIALCALTLLHVDSYLLFILAGATVLTLVGFIDDLYDIHPLIRLGANFAAAALVVGGGIGIAYVSNPFGPGVINLNQPQLAFWLFGDLHTVWVLADIFAILFIVWNINIVNWSKGVDGQMPGFVAIACVFIALLAGKFAADPTQFNVNHLALITAGAFTGLLIWNFYPQKILAGYGAGSLAGYFLAVLSILSGAKVATALMVLAVPTADAIFTITRRILAGKSPFWGDRGHLHHKLMDVLGWGRRRIAIFYWATTLVMGVLSLYLNTIGKIVTICIVLLLVFSFLIWAKFQSLAAKPRPKR